MEPSQGDFKQSHIKEWLHIAETNNDFSRHFTKQFPVAVGYWRRIPQGTEPLTTMYILPGTHYLHATITWPQFEPNYVIIRDGEREGQMLKMGCETTDAGVTQYHLCYYWVLNEDETKEEVSPASTAPTTESAQTLLPPPPIVVEEKKGDQMFTCIQELWDAGELCTKFLGSFGCPGCDKPHVVPPTWHCKNCGVIGDHTFVSCPHECYFFRRGRCDFAKRYGQRCPKQHVKCADHHFAVPIIYGCSMCRMTFSNVSERDQHVQNHLRFMLSSQLTEKVRAAPKGGCYNCGSHTHRFKDCQVRVCRFHLNGSCRNGAACELPHI